MTGAILRRLREHYGFDRRVLAAVAGKPAHWAASLEHAGRSHSAYPYHNRRQHRNFAAYIAALRALKARRAKR